MFQISVYVFGEEKFINSHIKCWDNLLGVRNQLTIQICIKVFQMTTIEVQEWFSYQIYL